MSWISVLWLPIVPLRAWSAIYLGETPSLGDLEGGPAVAGLRRERLSLARIVLIYARAALAATIATAPCAIMIARTQGRAATKPEFAIVIASTIWAVAVILVIDYRRVRKMKRTRSPEAIAGRMQDRLL